MSKAGLQIEDVAMGVYRLVDRATYSITGGRLKLGSDLWATDEELAVASAKFNPLDEPLCDSAEPMTIGAISLLLAEGRRLPPEHEQHPPCLEMYERLLKKRPSPKLGERYLGHLQRRRSEAAAAVGGGKPAALGASAED